jgi:hypothetical protein
VRRTWLCAVPRGYLSCAQNLAVCCAERIFKLCAELVVCCAEKIFKLCAELGCVLY